MKQEIIYYCDNCNESYEYELDALKCCEEEPCQYCNYLLCKCDYEFERMREDKFGH